MIDQLQKSEESLISVIIPVYNGSKYLDDCLKCILTQTYSNLEVIVVNDGSTDGSGEIIGKYAKNDHRIRPINLSNGGVSRARNKGLAAAHGDYVHFIDADDVFSTNLIETLYLSLTKANADIAMCKFVSFSEFSTLNFTDSNERLIMNCDQILTDVLITKQTSGYLFNKMFRNSIIRDKNIRFDENIHVNEDENFIMDYLDTGSKGVFTLSILYGYRITPGSLTNSGVNEKRATSIYAREIILSQLKSLTKCERLIENEKTEFF